MLNQLNQVLEVTAGTHANSLLRMLSKLVTFLDFRIKQDSVATYCKRGGNLCSVHIENFLMNQMVKEF